MPYRKRTRSTLDKEDSWIHESFTYRPSESHNNGKNEIGKQRHEEPFEVDLDEALADDDDYMTYVRDGKVTIRQKESQRAATSHRRRWEETQYEYDRRVKLSKGVPDLWERRDRRPASNPSDYNPMSLVAKDGRVLKGPKRKVMRYSMAELRERRNHFGSTLSVYDRKKFAREFDVNSLNLSAEKRRIWDENDHMRQVFANGYEFIRLGRSLVASDRYVTDSSGRTPYRRRMGEAKTVEHWGQRKLLMSEIEFLTLHAKPGDVVVYAGAAPGTHTNYLSAELFPELRFVLVDPSRFDAYDTDKVEVYRDYFTDETAKKYANWDNVLFISDIRSMSMEMTEKQKEERVIADMEAQMRWHKIMKPKASMLKFRLPYSKGKSEYLYGKIYFPVWSGRTTTETRLIVTDPEGATIQYDHIDYESVMFHFNTVTRTTYCEHGLEDLPGYKDSGIDHCFDCCSEIYILKEYLKKHGGADDTLDREALKMSIDISRKISKTGRSLKLDLEQRNRHIREEEHDD